MKVVLNENNDVLFVLFLILFKWCTCQLKYPCGDLECAFNDLIECLEKSHKNHAALPVASAVSSRTKYLLGGGVKPSLCIEAERRKTFMSWPHKEYRFVIIWYHLKISELSDAFATHCK